MKYYSKKVLTLLLSLVLILSMSFASAFAADGDAAGDTPAASEAFSNSITVTDSDGNAITVTGADIINSGKVTVTSDKPWKYNGTSECFGTFYSLKKVLDTAGIDYSEAHGLKVVATDGFVSGYTPEEVDKLYIFDMSEVSRGGSYGTAGQYGLGIEDYEGTTAGNRWATDVAEVAVADSHAWFIKKGSCKHYCAICGEHEPSIVINPDSEDPVTVYECEIKAAASEEATEESPWKGGKSTYVGTFYSLKSILESKGVAVGDCHGITAKGNDGFTNGFSTDEIDEIFIYDQGEVLKIGPAAGEAGTFGTAVNGGAGKKWAKSIVTVALTDTHVWFFKDGECKHYCAICDEDEHATEIEAEVPAKCKAAGKEAVYKYDSCGAEFGGEEIPALGHKWDSGKVTKAATTTATGMKKYTCTVCGETKTETIAKLPKKTQPMTVKAKTATLKFKTLKKKAQKLAVSKILTVKSAQGTKTYSITKVNKNKKYFKINAKTGKITVKKGLKKGTYKVTVKVAAAGNNNYKAGSKKVTVKIKVK